MNLRRNKSAEPEPAAPIGAPAPVAEDQPYDGESTASEPAAAPVSQPATPEPVASEPVAPQPVAEDTAPPASAAAAPESAPAPAAPEQETHFESPNMLPGREVRRSPAERILVRLIATCGIVGIGVAIAAIMVHSKSQGWIIGLVVSIVSVALSAILWSSRQL
jgi:hypothetical protein